MKGSKINAVSSIMSPKKGSRMSIRKSKQLQKKSTGKIKVKKFETTNINEDKGDIDIDLGV